MTITFRKIDETNYNECIILKVGKHQENYVASNAISLVQSFYEKNLYPLGIYHDDTMIGFILYDYDQELQGWSFSRFMIDIKYQNKGYGTLALNQFLDFFVKEYPGEVLYTSVEVDNLVALKLYENHGFMKQDAFEYTVGDQTYKEYRLIKNSFIRKS